MAFSRAVHQFFLCAAPSLVDIDRFRRMTQKWNGDANHDADKRHEVQK